VPTVDPVEPAPVKPILPLPVEPTKPTVDPVEPTKPVLSLPTIDPVEPIKPVLPLPTMCIKRFVNCSKRTGAGSRDPCKQTCMTAEKPKPAPKDEFKMTTPGKMCKPYKQISITADSVEVCSEMVKN
jgi:hypothetical protein